MIGLSPAPARLYQRFCDAYALQGSPLPYRQVLDLNEVDRDHTRKHVDRLVKKGFATFSSDCVTPLAPPHETVLAEIGATMGLSGDEIKGPCKNSRLLRARKMVAKRLKQDHHYSVRQISVVLNKHVTTVDDYFHQDRAARKSARRIAANRAAKARQMVELREAA